MYFTRLPDHRAPNFNEQYHFEKFGKNNIIFHDKVKHSFCEKHIGCLSVKFVFSGKEWYGVDGRMIAVEPGRFLILNNDQSYSYKVDSPQETEVFSIFFKTSLASAVWYNWQKTENEILDSPLETSAHIPEFFQTLYNTDSFTKQLLYQLRHRFLQQCGNTEEILIDLLHHMINLQQDKLKQVVKVNALKPSTRLEVYKRISVARDVLLSQNQEKIDLDQISRIACLSVPQLVRQFKAVYGKTPYQYLVSERLKKSAQLLANTSININEIAFLCGFEDASAFSRAFRKQFKTQPSFYRKNESLQV